MGGELVRGSSDNDGGEVKDAPDSYRSYSDIFHELFPFYLSIGMTDEQYWDGDCMLTKDYRKAYEMQKKRQNQMLWLQGAYVYNAILDASPILQAFAKKGTKPLPYLEDPIPLSKKEARELKEEKERRAYEKMRQRVIAWKEGVNKHKGGEAQNAG